MTALKDKIINERLTYYSQNKENRREYYLRNKENITQNNHDYYSRNKENIAQRRKENYCRNKEKIAQQRQETLSTLQGNNTSCQASRDISGHKRIHSPMLALEESFGPEISDSNASTNIDGARNKRIKVGTSDTTLKITEQNLRGDIEPGDICFASSSRRILGLGLGCKRIVYYPTISGFVFG